VKVKVISKFKVQGSKVQSFQGSTFEGSTVHGSRVHGFTGSLGDQGSEKLGVRFAAG
jgi:hypothetical protein